MTTSAARRRVNLTMVALTVGTALSPVNSSMIAVALIDLQGAFEVSLAQVTWVVTIYYLASIVGQPLMGRLVDALGSKPVFLAGMGIVVVAVLVAPFGGFAVVCIARAAMALGMAAPFPAAVALVDQLSERGGISSQRLLARIQVINTAGAAVGPVLGGFLVTPFGWQAVFLVNVPLALIAGAGVLFLAPRSRPRPEASGRALLRNLDLGGIVAFAVGAVLLMLGVLDGVPGLRWWVLSAGVAVLALFVWWELRARLPFINVRMIGRNATLRTSYPSFILLTAVFYLVMYGLPQVLEGSAGYTPAEIGLMLLPLAAATVVCAPIVARAIERWGERSVLVAGAILLVPATVSMLLGAATTSPVAMVMITASIGVVYSILGLAVTQAVQRAAPAGQVGVASGLLQATRYTGAIVASVILGPLLAESADTAAWGPVALVGIGLGVAYLAINLLGARGIPRRFD